MWNELKNAVEGHSKRIELLSEDAKMSAATIYAWMNEMPNVIKRFLSLCKALEISPNTLLAWTVDEDDSDEKSLSEGTVVKHNAKNEKPSLSLDDLLIFAGYIEANEKDYRDRLKSGKIDVEIVKRINDLVDLQERVQEAIYEAAYSDSDHDDAKEDFRDSLVMHAIFEKGDRNVSD